MNTARVSNNHHRLLRIGGPARLAARSGAGRNSRRFAALGVASSNSAVVGHGMGTDVLLEHGHRQVGVEGDAAAEVVALGGQQGAAAAPSVHRLHRVDHVRAQPDRRRALLAQPGLQQLRAAAPHLVRSSCRAPSPRARALLGVAGPQEQHARAFRRRTPPYTRPTSRPPRASRTRAVHPDSSKIPHMASIGWRCDGCAHCPSSGVIPRAARPRLRTPAACREDDLFLPDQLVGHARAARNQRVVAGRDVVLAADQQLVLLLVREGLVEDARIGEVVKAVAAQAEDTLLLGGAQRPSDQARARRRTSAPPSPSNTSR